MMKDSKRKMNLNEAYKIYRSDPKRFKGISHFMWNKEEYAYEDNDGSWYRGAQRNPKISIESAIGGGWKVFEREV